MKWLARAGVAFLVLVAATLGLLLWALPRLAKSEAARVRIEDAARAGIGRELRYGEIDFGLLPPSLVVTEPSLAGEGEGAPPLARAERVSLRVELVPLFQRRLEVSSLVVDGLDLHVVRGDAGLSLPGAGSSSPPAGAPGATPAPVPDGAGESEASIPLGIRTIQLRDASLELEDRTVSPAATTRLEQIELRARGVRDQGPISLDGSLRLETGGELKLEGSAEQGGALDLLVTLSDVALAAARPYVGAERLAGRLGGTLRLTGDQAAPTLAARLRVEDADLAVAGAQVVGPLALEADVADALAAAGGPFSLDASAADVRYGNDFHKAPGTPLRLRGQLLTDRQGALGADDLVLELRNLIANGEVRSGPAAALRVKAAPFALDGWEELLPPLGLARPRGRLGIAKLEMGSDRDATRGVFVFDALEVNLPEKAPVSFTGEVAWSGATLRTRDMQLRAADQPISVSGSLQQIYTAPRYEMSFETRGADANALLAGFAGQPDRLHGPLDAKGTLRGTLSGDTPALEALTGNVDFDVQGGRIVGASLLEAALGSFGARLADAERQRDPKRWERFTSEKFELLDGALRVANGVLLTQPVRLRYRDYGAQLEGKVRLEDLGLDLKGTLEIAETLDAELARAFGVKADYQPQRRVVPLASVRGTLGAPKVQISATDVASLAASYASSVPREELRRRVEQQLGKGTGDVVDQGLGVLEGLLKGRTKSGE